MAKLRQVYDLTTSTSRYTASYEGSGTRVSSVLAGVSHVYSFGLHDTAGNTTYTGGAAQRKGGTDRFYHQDRMGSTRYLSDSTGNAAPTAYRNDAYGNQTAAQGPDETSYNFAGAHGYQSDAPGGLQLLGAR